MLTFLVVYGMFFLVLSLIGISLYAVFAFALYRMTINAKIENPWLACIPIVQLYILAKLIKSLKISDYEIPHLEYVLPCATIIVMILGGIPVIGSLLSIANFVLLLFSLNKLYKIYKPEQALLFTVLSIFSLPIPFIFLSIKDVIPFE